MSSTDERVVALKFDNSGFESGANRAIDILGKLENALKFKNASSGLDSIQASSDRFNMNGVSNSIEIISSRFSVFQEFVTGVFRRLGERAADFGTGLVRNVTLKPLTDGFSEYELQMKSIQTISANTGLSGTDGINKINEALDELNVYADKTIYNFSEMTRNIGTFTAAGVDLDTSTKAIQGIANLAAVSGSTSQQASTAMYQLSQALASGTVKLQDWNSVVNAGMGGQVFQEALKRTARAHGIAVDDMIEKNGSFRESLHEGWLTSEVLTDTLNQLAISYDEVGDDAYNTAYNELLNANYSKEDAEAILELAKTAEEAATMVRTWTQLWDTVGEALGSGWAASWRIIIGDFNAATEFFTWASTKLSDIINQSSEARNKFLTEWAEAGGRTGVINLIANSFTALEKVVSSISDAFSKVFGVDPTDVAETILALSEMSESLILNDTDAKYLSGTFEILFGLLKDAGSVFLDVADYVTSFALAMADAFNKANAFRRITKIIKNLATAIYKPLSSIGSAFSEVFNIDEKFAGDAAGVIGRFLGILENFSESLIISDDSANKLKETFKSLFTTIKSLFDPLEDKGSKVLDFFSTLSKNVKDSGFLDGLTEKISSLDFGSIFDKVKTGAGLGAIVLIGKWIKDVLDKIAELKEGLNPLSGISDVFDNIGSSLETWQKNLKVDTILKISIAIGILAASLFVLSKIPAEQVVTTVELFATSIAGLLGAFAGFSKLSKGGKVTAAASLLLIAGSLLILSVALNKLKDLNWEQLGRGLSGIGGMLLELIVSLNNMPKSGRILSSAVAMVLMSVAIGALALSMKLLATISWEDIGKGLAAIGGLLLEFGIALNAMPKSGKILSSAVGMVLMSVAIGALALSMKLLATISWEDIGKGLAAIGGLLLEFGIALNAMPDSGRILSSAAAMVLMSIAIGALAVSMKLLSTISWEDIGKGLLSIAVLMLELGVALQFMSANIGGAAAAILAAAAIGILAVSMKLLASIDWEDIGKGLASVGGLLLGLGIALAVFQANIGGAVAMLIASVSIIALSAAINILVPAITALSALSLEQIGTALLALGGAFVVLGAASFVLSLAAAPTIAFSAAMLMLAAAAYLVSQAISTLITALTPVLPSMIEAGANVVNGFLQGVSSLWSMVSSAATQLGSTFLSGIKSFFGIASPSTVMDDMGGYVVEGFVQGLSDESLLSSLEAAGINLDETVLSGLDGLPEDMQLQATEGMDGFIGTIGSYSGTVGTTGAEVTSSLSNGLKGIDTNLSNQGSSGMTSLVTGMNGKLGLVKSKAREVSSAVSNSFNSLPATMRSKGESAMQAFANGISSASGTVRSTAQRVVNSASDVSSQGGWNSFYNIGSYIVRGLEAGMNSRLANVQIIAQNMINTAATAARTAAAIASPSKLFMEIGGYVGEGFIIGMKDYIPKASQTGEDLANAVPDAFSDALSNLSFGIDDILDTDYTPEITPILNPTEFNSGLANLSSTFNAGFANLSIGNLNYAGELSAKIDDYNDINRQVVEAMSKNGIDYDLLGVSVANALIRSGVHVEIDGGQLMGYLAGEVSAARRQFSR